METQESQWINIADIMSALMMIFMFIAIAFLYQLLEQKEIYRVELNKALHQEFDNDLQKWKATITSDNIMRFDSPFQVGKPDIPPSFENILNDFFPRYIKLLSSKKFKTEIDEIRVEGHTSNGWGKVNQKNSYLYNMHLSQQRASNVLTYCYNINSKIIDTNLKWLQSNLRANGMSFAKLLYKDQSHTVPDQIRSRRVEFKVVTIEHRE